MIAVLVAVLVTALPSVSSWLTFLVLVASAIGAVIAIWKYVIKHVVHFFKDVRKAVMSINGYDALTDPTTGAVVQEPTEPLANRVRTLEHLVIGLADISERLTRLEEWKTNYERNNTKE